MNDIKSHEIPSIFRCPPEGCTATTDELMECQAGRAYIADARGERHGLTAPALTLDTDQRGSGAQYEIFSDGSLWFVNPSKDEIWTDAREFVKESLIPSLKCQVAGDLGYKCIDRMDLEMILWYVLTQGE